MVAGDGAGTTTRVLVVDDSVVVRRLVSTALDGDPRLRVVGTAANGHIALAKISQVTPDVVTLDVEMTGLDGLQTLARIRAEHPDVRVIMFSTLTERGAAATVEALLHGADDYVTKPSGSSDPAAAVEQIRAALVPKVVASAGPGGRPRPGGHARSRRAATPETATERLRSLGAGRAPSAAVDVVAIGVSTGGPNALAAVVPELPVDLGVPVVVVQHMPEMFTRMLAERLDQNTPLRVREGVQGAALLPGQVWIAPGGRHMVVDRPDGVPRVGLRDSAPENSCRPSADVLLRAATATFGPGVLAVILTGMGHDGLRGCEQVKAAGGHVLAQDRASSVVWGMPGAVVEAGLADAVVGLADLPGEIAARVRGSRGEAAALRRAAALRKANPISGALPCR